MENQNLNEQFNELQSFLLCNDFEPSQIVPFAYSKGVMIVEVQEKTRIIEVKKYNAQDELDGIEPREEIYWIGKIQIINPACLEYDKDCMPCLYFNPNNLQDFLLKFSVINGDLEADFKFVKNLIGEPKATTTVKFKNDNSVLKYFLSNLFV